MALAVLAAELGLAPQQVGLQRSRLSKRRRATDLAGSAVALPASTIPLSRASTGSRRHARPSPRPTGRRDRQSPPDRAQAVDAPDSFSPGSRRAPPRRLEPAFERRELGVEPPALPPRGRVLSAQLAGHVKLGQLVGDAAALAASRAPAHGDDVALALAARRSSRSMKRATSRAAAGPLAAACRAAERHGDAAGSPGKLGVGRQTEGLDGLARQRPRGQDLQLAVDRGAVRRSGSRSGRWRWRADRNRAR